MKKILFILLVIISVCTNAQIPGIGTVNYVQENAPNRLSNNLVAYYSFDSNATDLTGNGYDGTVNGATVSDGILNDCYDYDGSNDYIELENTASGFSFIQNTLVFSISCWIEIESTQSTQSIIGSTTTDAKKGFVLANKFSSSGVQNLRFVSLNGNAGEYYTTDSDNDVITDTNWHHVVVTGDGTDILFYIDGELVATNIEVSFTDYSSGDADYNTLIGMVMSVSTLDLPFDGKIDEVAIYDATLSPKQIRDLNDGGKPLSFDEFTE